MERGLATVNYIHNRAHSKTALKRVIDYVTQLKKTQYVFNGKSTKLISGVNCTGDSAYAEFMATKELYNKEVGVFYYHLVQSFSPDEKASPEQIHEIGRKLAEYFKGHEVLIATHIDVDHKHNHLIINSVNFETGYKLQEGRDGVKRYGIFQMSLVDK